MGDALYLKPKMGIIPELSIQNYETVSEQFREIITNALDAGAKNVRITLNRTSKGADLIIEDDGHGMDGQDFRNEFLALGGSRKFLDKKKIGRIGIGFLAAIPLCKFIEIQSRTDKSNKAFLARLDCEKFTLEGLRMEEVKDIQIGEMISTTTDADKLGLPHHFTKISLLNLNKKLIDIFNDNEELKLFIEELEKILPIDYEDNPLLFSIFSGELKNELQRLNKSNKLNVYLNSEIKLRRKIFEFSDINKVEAFREIIDKPFGNGMKASGYLIAANKILDESWRGINFRVLNVTVEHSFMGLGGYESRKRYITGELHIKGIDKNKAISINRNQFNEDNEQVIELSEFIEDLIIDFQKGINTRWNVKSLINKKIKKIQATNKAIKEASKAIGNVVTKERAAPKEKGSSLSKYKEKAILSGEDLAKELNLDKKQKINVSITKDIKDEGGKKGYAINWKDYEGFKADIKIDPDLLDDIHRIIKIDKDSFKCYFVEGKKEDNPCEINFSDKKIFFNLNHKLVSNLEGYNILFSFILEYCYKKYKTKEEFYEMALSMLSDPLRGK